MNTLSHEQRCAVVRCLVDGCSIRATTRITGVAKNTIQKLTRELGQALLEFHDNVVRNVKSQRVQCSEEGPEARYSVPKCNGKKKKVIMGDPDRADISTSYAERQNLNIRMQNRRFTRLTNAFSKKAEMLEYSLAITFFYHNFVRIHQTFKSTPPIKAEITDHKWSVEEMVDLLPEATHPNRKNSN